MNNRVYSLDTIKAIAALMVVLIHYNPFWGVNSTGFLILDSISRTAVPFFFMVSGLLLAYSEKKMNIDELIKKRLKTLFFIYIFWGSLYYLYEISTKAIEFSLKDILKKIFINGMDAHLWFFPSLIYAMLVLYFFIKIKKINYCIYLGIILYVIGFFGDTQIFSINGRGIIPINTRNLIFESLIFVSLGYVMYSSKKIMNFINNSSNLKLSIITGIIYVFMIIEKYYEKYGDYNVLLIFTTIFIFMMALKNREFGKNTLINTIGKYSLGIYLIHFYFVIKLKGVINIQNKYALLISKVLIVILIYLLSLILYILVLKIYNRLKKYKINI